MIRPRCSPHRLDRALLRGVALAVAAVTAIVAAHSAHAEVRCTTQAQVFCTSRADTLAMLEAWKSGDGKKQDAFVRGGRCFLLAAGLRLELLEPPANQPTVAVAVTMANAERFSGFTPTAQMRGSDTAAACRD